MSTPLIDIRQLTIAFGTGPQVAPVVDDVSISIATGECLGIVGESGSGKSLTALAMMQLLPPTARVGRNSEILLDGQNILNFSEREMRRIRGGRIGMIFQDAMSALNPVFTIGYQLYEVLKLHRGLGKRAAREHGMQLLDEVGIKDPARCWKAYPHQLSGGMRQRAMIAMALCGDPDILIADEPTTALDVTIQAQVLELLVRLKQQRQMTLIFISHDLAVVSNLADDVVVMQQGVKVEHARATQFFQNPQHPYSKQLIAAIPPTVARHPDTPAKDKILEINNLEVHFPIRKGILKRTVGHVKAVNGVSFDIPKGQTVALVGESGSGKTTTGKAILNLLTATHGQITFGQHDLVTIKRHQMQALRQDIQIIFQDPHAALNPRMMIIDCIAEGLIAQKRVRSRKQAEPIVETLLQQVELDPEMKWRYPHEFSGGQRQRICIARALALEPKLLILDEPTSALDVSIQMQILQLLESLQQRLGLSYLLITHNLSVVAYMAHSMAVMHQGQVVEHGATAKLLSAPQHPYTQQLLASIPQWKTHSQHETA